MKDQRLEEFMKDINIINDKIAIYTNKDKGLTYPLTTATLLCRVDYLELTKNELEKAKFEQKVENKEYKMFDCERVVPKDTVTKDKKDQFTLTKSQVKATHIYNVSNQIGIIDSYEDKDKAFEICNKINQEVLKVME